MDDKKKKKLFRKPCKKAQASEAVVRACANLPVGIEVADLGDGWVRVGPEAGPYIDGHVDAGWSVVVKNHKDARAIYNGSAQGAVNAYLEATEPVKEPVVATKDSKPAKTKAGKEKK